MFDNSYSSYTVLAFPVGCTGQYNDMMARPFQMHASAENLDSFCLNTQNGLNINQQNVMVEHGSLISVTGDTKGRIEIDQGWATQRNMFTLILEDTTRSAKYILNGFTSADFIFNGQPNTYATLTFDSVIEMVGRQDFNGGMTWDIQDADNIIGANNLYGRIEGQTISQALRPIDVMNHAELRASAMGAMGQDQDLAVMDLNSASMLAENVRAPEFSRSTNGMANDFLYRSTKAFTEQRLMHDSEGLEEDLRNAMSADIIHENSFGASPLIATILSNASSKRAVSCSWGELCTALPGIERMIQIINGGGAVISMQEHWAGRSNEVRVGSEFAAAIPAAMRNCGICEVRFTIAPCGAGGSLDGHSNSFTYGAVNLTPANGQLTHDLMFIDVGVAQDKLRARFEALVRNVIYPSIAAQAGAVIQIHCSIYEDMSIGLSLPHGPLLMYSAPVWASSAWSPTSTSTMEVTQNMAKGMMELTNHMSQMQEHGRSSSAPSSSAMDYMAGQSGKSESWF